MYRSTDIVHEDRQRHKIIKDRALTPSNELRVSALTVCWHSIYLDVYTFQRNRKTSSINDSEIKQKSEEVENHLGRRQQGS